MRAWQINLQDHFGGGEVFTGFLSRALSKLGVPTTLFVSRRAEFWPGVALAPDVEIVPVVRAEEIRLPAERTWLLSHGPLSARIPEQLHHLRTAVAHMPPQGRDPRAYDGHDLVLPVSAWVLQGLREIRAPAWDEPLLGVAEARGVEAGVIEAGTPYDFDRRKLRDRLLASIHPLWLRLRPPQHFEKRAGLTLGIVSRLTPIKQFPLLFGRLVPQLAAIPGVNLEIFGAGGYASVRDLKSAVRALGDRVRFWGHQDNVRVVYGQLDYLLTGLPEKEALGLNVIEAQSCGVPVLAVRAAPFTETVVDGVTGFLYRDPRQDAGAEFGRLIERVLSGKLRPDPRLAIEHLARFSFDAFSDRVARLLSAIRDRLAA